MSAPQMTQAGAPNAAARALFARVSRQAAQAIVPINDAAADAACQAPAFYCIHSIAGAGGTDFLALAAALDGGIRLFGVQAPPKRMSEESFGATVESLAQAYADAIVQAQPSGSVFLGGWSAGAAIALEVAHHLRARGREIGLLVAIDGAPEIDAAGLRRWDPRYGLAVAANLPIWFFDTRAMDKSFPASIVLRLARSFVARGRRVAAAQKIDIDVQRLEGFISLDRYPPAQRRFMTRLYEAIMRYQPRAWDGPVVVYEARITPALSLPQYLQRWRWVAPQAERVRLEGNHVTIMRAPRVANLARDLRARIVQAAGQTAQARRLDTPDPIRAAAAPDASCLSS